MKKFEWKQPTLAELQGKPLEVVYDFCESILSSAWEDYLFNKYTKKASGLNHKSVERLTDAKLAVFSKPSNMDVLSYKMIVDSVGKYLALSCEEKKHVGRQMINQFKDSNKEIIQQWSDSKHFDGDTSTTDRYFVDNNMVEFLVHTESLAKGRCVITMTSSNLTEKKIYTENFKNVTIEDLNLGGKIYQWVSTIDGCDSVDEYCDQITFSLQL